MKKSNFNVTISMVIAAIVLILISQDSFARDLVAAGNSATIKATTIGKALSTVGIVAGGVLMQIPGLSEYGKRTCATGLLGAVCSFGGPAMINLINSIFG
jgi:hypothetical protein